MKIEVLQKEVALPVILMLAILMTPLAHSGEVFVRCSEPAAFSGATLNTYVKQFDVPDQPEQPLNEIGQNLALMIQLDGLYSQIGYGSLGFISLVPVPGDPPCTRESIFAKITGRECCCRGEIQPGHAALLLSGYFKAVQDDIYLLTRIDFVRRDVPEEINIPLPSEVARDLHFTGMLPRTSISLTPRKFTAGQIAAIQEAYGTDLIVRREPDETSPGDGFNPFRSRGIAFAITDVSDGWLRAEPYTPDFPNAGWLKVPEGVGGFGLREMLPDLYFLDAVAVYLQTVATRPALPRIAFQRHLNRFNDRMERFAVTAKGKADREALGLLHAMRGAMLMSQPNAPMVIMRAAEDFQKSAEMMPTNGNAQILAALSRFSADYFRQDLVGSFDIAAAASALEYQLLSALDAEPDNFFGKINLERLYVMRDRLEDNGWASEKVSKLRTKLRKDTTLNAKVPEE